MGYSRDSPRVPNKLRSYPMADNDDGTLCRRLFPQIVVDTRTCWQHIYVHGLNMLQTLGMVIDLREHFQETCDFEILADAGENYEHTVKVEAWLPNRFEYHVRLLCRKYLDNLEVQYILL